WHVQSGLPTGLTLDSNTGEISGTPTIAGTFTVIVRATNSGGYDVKPLTIIIAEAPAITNTYTVSVSADPAAGGTVSGGGEYAENTSVTVTATANSGYKFVKWTENSNEASTDASYTFTAAADRTLVAVFEQVQADEFEVSGTITGAEGSTYTSVTAKLIELGGKEYNAVVNKTSADSKTPETYHYATNAPAGHYNLVVTAKTAVGENEVTVTVTSLIDLSSDTENDVKLPSGQKNSVVDTNASGDYHAIVGGLDEIAKDAGGSNDIVEIKLTVTDKEENAVPAADAAAIKQEVQNTIPGSTLEFLDFTLTKTVNGQEEANFGSTNTHLLTIIIAFDSTNVNKDSIKIYRYHGGQAEAMTKNPADGLEGFAVGDTSITIYTKSFSTYAIGYTLEGASSGDDPVIDAPSSSNRKPKYDVKYEVEDTENGSVEISRSRAAKGKTVTITVTPDEGYQLDELVILDKNGNEVEYKDNGDGTYSFVMPRGEVEIRVSFAEMEKEQLMLIFTIDEKEYQKDDVELMNDVAPVIQCDRAMLPIRVVAENLGATVTWNEADQSVTITMGDKEIVIYIGQSFALVDGCPVELDSPAFIANDRAYLPMRFVAENLGATVTWDGVNQTVTIVG
ncbi:MAG: putative Ig domain-containing protein, partial [Anaerotignum sp.]|nr:putative Ig domain-containing protein [Anaerotignum sp.]